MKVQDKLLKQIFETKYLCTENSYRYRPIMRCFYHHYERLEYSLYKEDVFNELKENEVFSSYTIEECERDLETLVEWFSLAKMQDTKNATSIEEFKNKKFRYQMTEYATVIERLTITLEEMKIKTASLEPKLFERLKISIESLETIKNMSLSDINDLWNNLNDDFTKLNENYQDFLKKFNEPKSEELLQSTLFLQFKNEIIKYLREFIKGYQKNIYYIRDSISKIDNEMINILLDSLTSYYKKTPVLKENFDFEYFREVNMGKINNIFKWFVGSVNNISEGEKLMNTTDSIIVKITKYANSLIELHGNMTNRKEEYKYLIKEFDQLNTVSDAHKYASVVFGIENIKHFLGYSNINTDAIVNTYDIPPIEILLTQRTFAKREKVALKPIEDKSLDKIKLLEEYREEQKQNKEILKKLIKDKKIVLNNEIELSKIERRYITKLIANKSNKETEFGLSYEVLKSSGKCKIISDDGEFYMDALEIIFEGEL